MIRQSGFVNEEIDANFICILTIILKFSYLI